MTIQHIRHDPKEEVDVLVVGGGPSGTAAALTLKSYTSLSVELIERSGYEQWRIGEALSPGVTPLLHYLGIWNSFLQQKFLPASGVAAAWGSRELRQQNFMYVAQEHGWHVERNRFDAWLAKCAVNQGVRFQPHTSLRHMVKTPDGRWCVTLWDKAEKVMLKRYARFLVDASGAGACVARQLGAKRLIHDHLMGIAGIFELAGNKMQQSVVTIVEATIDGWWYFTRLVSNQIVVVFMSDPDIIRAKQLRTHAAFVDLVQTTTHLAHWLSGATQVAGPYAHTAYSQILDVVSGNGWIAAGEAAVGFDPLSSMGIGYAMLSGIEAARAAHSMIEGNSDTNAYYANGIMDHYEQYRRQQRAYYEAENRWTQAPFWARRRN